MKKQFSIQDYLRDNKIEVGSIKKEVGNSISKGSTNDLRKTSYDVNIVDGKLDLNTHKEIMTEASDPLNKGKKGNAILTMKLEFEGIEGIENQKELETELAHLIHGHFNYNKGKVWISATGTGSVKVKVTNWNK